MFGNPSAWNPAFSTLGSKTAIVRDLVESSKRIFTDGNFSDLTITCSDRQFQVHRVICCPKSRLFNRLCTGGFKEQFTREITFPQDDPRVLAKMISFFYSLDYDENSVEEPWMCGSAGMNMTPMAILDSSTLETEMNTGDIRPSADPFADEKRQSRDDMMVLSGELPPEAALDQPPPYRKKGKKRTRRSDSATSTPLLEGASALIISARVYSMAYKYDVPGLKLLAKEKFETSLRNNGTQDPGFAAATREVYQTTTEDDRGLRDIVVRAMVDNFKSLQTDESFVRVLREVQEVPLDILRQIHAM